MSAARILVVEDERIVAVGMSKRLQSLGYEVVALTTLGEEAVVMTEQLRPDLVLMDIHLEGEMDGVEAAAQIRARFRIPVVYLTAYSNREMLERAKVTEPYGYILKPYEDRELQVVVETAVHKHRMERKLEEREQWFAATLKSIGDGVVATDGQGRITFMNAVAETLTGWGMQEAAGNALEEVFKLVHEVTRQPVAAPLWQAMEQKLAVPMVNHTVLVARNDGERPVEDCATPILDDGGAPLGGVMVFRDVTERKKAEAEVAKLAAIVGNSDDAIVSFSPEGVISSWNGGAERLYGFRAAEVVGQSVLLLFLPDRTHELGPILEQIKAGQRILPHETVRRRKDGRNVEVLLSISPIKDATGRVTGAAGIVQDLTHVKKLEQKYLQAQKMEAIGRLAGGVAHDFNNLLTVINGYSQVLLGRLHEHDSAREFVQHIHLAGKRAAALTQQLLAYSRKQIQQLVVFDLNDVLAHSAKMLGRLIGEDVDLVLVPDPGLHPIQADPCQIEQVLMNLAVNARDAMPTGGRLTIETKNVQITDAHAAEVFEIPFGPYVLLAVSDTGCGMDAETQAHLFEPFFTTKGEGKGTGLGLATVYGIVKQSGGYVKVYSVPGQGATFKVYLPSLEDAAHTEALNHDTDQLPRGSETVLVVEDEATVRWLTAYLLQQCGYKVLAAAGGAEALAIVGQHEGPLDLLVTDVVMPKMSGRQVAEALRPTHPALRVLYLSGYTDDAVFRHGILESETAFLQKPFTQSALAHKVREVLDISVISH